ncbi:hypothetical protein C8J56DRAFT_901384 [Mycena floridula]|nr:hypothetical protein C8J56DRAFT_901384 [Mycena floridula]
MNQQKRSEDPIHRNNSQLVININAQAMRSLVNTARRLYISHPELVTDNHSPQYFIFKLMPTSEVLGVQNGPDWIIQLGRSKPYDLRFDAILPVAGTFASGRPYPSAPVITVSAPPSHRLDDDRVIIPPLGQGFSSFRQSPELWYAVQAGLVPGVYHGWADACECSIITENSKWSTFPTRAEAVEQYSQWALNQDLQILDSNGSLHTRIKAYEVIETSDTEESHSSGDELSDN